MEDGQESEIRDDTVDEGQGIMPGRRLALLWNYTPAQTHAKKGKYKGGRPPKSGRTIIEDAAKKILLSATVKHNPRAESLGLGPCQIGRGIGTKSEGSRPRKQLTAPIGKNGARVQFGALAYHITWCAEVLQAPPQVPGLGWSHRCHDASCVNPRHGLWQQLVDNKDRDDCRDNPDSCEHTPVCIPR